MQASPIFNILQWTAALVTISELPVTCHYHPEPIVYIRVYSFLFLMTSFIIIL